MFTDFLGATLNLTQLAGSASTYRLVFVADDGSDLDLSNCTFSGNVTSMADGSINRIGIAMSSDQANILGLSFPALPIGNYCWGLMCCDDTGDAQRVIQGQLLIVSTNLDLSNDAGKIHKTLQVRLPAAEANNLQCQWMASTAAQLAAEQAINASKGIDAKLDTVTELANQAKEHADKAQAELADAEAFMDSFDNRISDAIKIDPDDGSWVIGGIDTNRPSTGSAGKSPYINSAGHWQYYNDVAEQWIDGGQANGNDGIDGRSTKLLVLPNISFAPTPGDGVGVYCPCYDDNDNRYFEVYQWLYSTGSTAGQWTLVGTTNQTHSSIASTTSYGLVRLSTNTTTSANCVGINADGSLGVTNASLTAAGIVRLGSQFSQSNPQPYIVGIGATADHQLSNNLLFGGALQHMSPTIWSQQGMPWLADQMSSTPEWYNDAYYLGLNTTNQFNQSVSGLSLQPASTTLLAGVYLANNLEDDRTNAVPTAQQVSNVTGNMYTKAEVDAMLADVQEKMEEQHNSLIKNIKAWIIAQGYDTEANVNNKLSGYVKSSASVTEIQALTADEFNGLTDRNDTTLYIN